MYLGYIYRILLTSADNFSRNNLKRAKKPFLTFFDHFRPFCAFFGKIMYPKTLLLSLRSIWYITHENQLSRSGGKVTLLEKCPFLTYFWPFLTLFGYFNPIFSRIRVDNLRSYSHDISCPITFSLFSIKFLIESEFFSKKSQVPPFLVFFDLL